jgi:MarR family 2-MHQ and catechol resistance regulon transcriptional repressor
MAPSRRATMAQPKNTVKEAAGIQAFSVLQRALHKISGDIFSTLHSNNMTGSQFGVLEALHKHGPVVQRDLAGQIMKTTGNITTVIDNLEKSRLVERIRGEKDRRYFEIVLTPEGGQLIKKIYPAHLKQVEKVLSRITEKERNELVRICGKLEGVEE